MEADQGVIKSNSATDLPTAPGLTFVVIKHLPPSWLLTMQTGDGQRWKWDQSDITVIVAITEEIPPAITIAGESGGQDLVMGTYTLVQSRRFNGYPLYRMKIDESAVESGDDEYATMYRSKDGGQGQGRWRITRRYKVAPFVLDRPRPRCHPRFQTLAHALALALLLHSPLPLASPCPKPHPHPHPYP